MRSPVVRIRHRQCMRGRYRMKTRDNGNRYPLFYAKPEARGRARQLHRIEIFLLELFYKRLTAYDAGVP